MCAIDLGAADQIHWCLAVSFGDPMRSGVAASVLGDRGVTLPAGQFILTGALRGAEPLSAVASSGPPWADWPSIPTTHRMVHLA